ncbi:MAG: S41 family peptidase [Treponema sp.]|jgi:hypothetical protein|nr:S41 family peptidase [Treponema sp.]
MKKKLAVILTIILITPSCHVFLGPQPDSSPKGIFDRIWTDFNETYALFDIRGVDWDDIYAIYSPQISQDMNDYELFRICANMLNAIQDPHVGLLTPFGHSYLLNYQGFDYEELINENREPFDIGVVCTYLSDEYGIAVDGSFLYGKFGAKPNVGYLYIGNFFEYKLGIDIIPDWVKEIDGILKTLMDNTDILVLDLRGSWGGLGSNMDYVASRFASTQEDYIQFCTKNGPGRNDFSTPITWSIKPAGLGYTRPIILLTNRETISASEWFIMALKTQSHVTHVGAATCGAFSARVIRPLINGWEYSVSVMKVTDIAGKCYEGIGISPNEEHIVENDWDAVRQNKDAQLEYALSLFWR